MCTNRLCYAPLVVSTVKERASCAQTLPRRRRLETGSMNPSDPYVLERQVGFVMRRAVQRHIAIFSSLIPELTPTQFAALAKLCELGQASQNELGRLTSMDAATIKGVVDRLRARDLISAAPLPATGGG